MRVGQRQVGDDGKRRAAVALAEFACERHQALLAPRDQRDVVATLGQKPGERRADAGRRSGDERELLSHQVKPPQSHLALLRCYTIRRLRPNAPWTSIGGAGE